MENSVQISLTPERAVAALKDACPSEGWMFLPAEGKITFLFYCRKNTLCLHPVLWMRNTMRKDLYLTLHANEKGCKVVITPRFTPFFRWFTVFWFSMLFIFALMASFAGEFFLLIPIACIGAAAVGVLAILRRFARRDEAAIFAEAVKLLLSLQ